jgi:Restriction endonuclease BglII
VDGSLRYVTATRKVFVYRFAEQVLNSKLAIKQEIDEAMTHPSIYTPTLSRPEFNKVLRDKFNGKGWEDQPDVFQGEDEPSARMDFLKERVGMRVGFGHTSFIGNDLLKFQVSSYSALDQIGIGIFVTTTKSFQKKMRTEFANN